MIRALARQIERWNRDNPANLSPPIQDKDRYALRLAALFHDIGHGPFSHAIEPVLDADATLEPNAETGTWRHELKAAQAALRAAYAVNSLPSISETIAVPMLLSDPVHQILATTDL